MNSNYHLKDFQSLETLRDEVVLHAHLLKADLKDKYVELEKEWNKLSSELKHVQTTAKESTHEVSEVTHYLFETVRDGYEKIKHSLSLGV